MVVMTSRTVILKQQTAVSKKEKKKKNFNESIWVIVILYLRYRPYELLKNNFLYKIDIPSEQCHKMAFGKKTAARYSNNFFFFFIIIHSIIGYTVIGS